MKSQGLEVRKFVCICIGIWNDTTFLHIINSFRI